MEMILNKDRKTTVTYTVVYKEDTDVPGGVLLSNKKFSNYEEALQFYDEQILLGKKVSLIEFTTKILHRCK